MTLGVGQNNGLANALAGAAGAPTQSDGSLGDFDTFLQLLVTQLQNQDPLNPLESAEFTSQLATFSQLEQQVQANDLLEELTTQSDFSAQLLAVSYIDQDVLAPSGLELQPADVTIEEGQTEFEFAYDLETAAAESTVQLRDADGNVLKTLDGGLNQGINFLSFELVDGDGNPIPPGDYVLTVTANQGGERVTSRLYDYSAVRSVTGDDAGATLALQDGREVELNDVLRVRSGTESASL